MTLQKILIASGLVNVLSSCQFGDKKDLRENSNIKNILLTEQSSHVKDYDKGTLNYVRTLLYTWKLMQTDTGAFSSDRLLQSLSAVGDIKSISRFSIHKLVEYPQLQDSSYLNKFIQRPLQYDQARRTILNSFKGRQIIMFNEAHDRPQTRAFLLSLLFDLKRLGATCLAMEALDEQGSMTELDQSTGYLTTEPVSGEIVREALRLGYKLIPYEDKTGNSTINQRDSVQAVNLFNRIKTNEGIRKTVVLAGYGHISERPLGDFISMATNFKKISGIDPVTVEQTLLLENMKESPYANRLITTVVATDSVLAFTSPEVMRFGLDTATYDIYVYHPPTKYFQERPTWLLSTLDRRFVDFELPEKISPVFIQAYYKDEIHSDRDYLMKIPAEQTFFSIGNRVSLALRKDVQYAIVFRDDNNRILLVQNIKP